LCIRSLIDMCSRRLVACDEVLLRHDLQELENGGVAGLAAHLFGDLADRARPAGPEDAKDGELGVGGLTAERLHCGRLSTTLFVDVNTNVFVDHWEPRVTTLPPWSWFLPSPWHSCSLPPSSPSAWPRHPEFLYR